MKGYGMLAINKPGWIEKDKPVAGPLDAIIKPKVIAPCSSDVHVLHGGSAEKTNLILGHEAVGEVVEIGSLVTKFKAGDIVVVPATTPNWEEVKLQGAKNNAHDIGPLSSFKFLGSKDGVFAEFFHVNNADANLVLLPTGVKPEAALMTVDMMSTGLYGTELSEVGFGDTVVVIGIGPVGLMAIAGAKLKGAGRIVAVGTRPNCVKIAKEYGATDIISYKEGDIVKQIMSLVGEADSCIIAGGTVDTISQAVTMIKPGGTVANLNFLDTKDVVSFPSYLWGLGMADKSIKGGFCPGGAGRIKKMLNMLEYGRVDTTKLITHRFEGLDKIEEAFKLMEDKPSDLIKPVVFIN